MKTAIHASKVSILACLLVLSACSNSDGTPSSNTNQTSQASIEGLANCEATSSDQSVVCGKIMATDGVTPISGAEIELASTGTLKSNFYKGIADPNQCLTDSNGEFACLLPSGVSGSQQFIVNISGFTAQQFSVVTTPGTIVDSGIMTLAADDSQKWVVVPGSYDGVQVLLAQLKGCTLNNSEGLPFDASNDSHTEARSSTDCTSKGLLILDDFDMSSALYPETFLQSQSLHDYDALFINCAANLSDLDLDDGPINTNIKQFANTGKSIYFSDLSSSWLTDLYPDKVTFLGNNTNTGTIVGDVLHSGLAGVVGNTIDLVFDLSVWSAIDNVAENVHSFIDADMANISDYTGVHPVTVGWKETVNSGCIFYTSYHIEGASSGAPQELAMKYLIQNLDQVCQ